MFYERDGQKGRTDGRGCIMAEISRRAFVGATAAAGIGAIAMASGSGHGASAAMASDKAESADSASSGSTAAGEVDKVISCDIVIVGSGSSGCCAAMEAADQGADVILVEKQDVIGGMEFGTEGAFGLGSKMQIDAQVELPSANDVIEEELVYSNYRVNPLVWRDFITNSGADIDWLVDHGIVFDRVDDYMGGSSFKCFHWFPNGAGTDFGTQVAAYLEGKDNATVMTGTKCTGLVTSGGAVGGIYATDADGAAIEIDAKAVIMCNGGFPEDKELVSEKVGYDVTGCATFDGPDTGECHHMMVDAGADDSPSVCLIPVVTVPGMRPEGELAIAAGYEGLLVVNQDGERFMAEDLFTKKLFALTINSYLTQDSVFTVFDDAAITRFETEGIPMGFLSYATGAKFTTIRDDIASAIEEGSEYVFQADTLEELAEQMGVDPAGLAQTVETYNGYCDAGEDPDFGCSPALLSKVETGPFYALVPGMFYTATIGGVKVNRSQQVIGTDGEPIQGLYSAGTESSMLYKETYNFQLSGGMNAYCYYSGRHAVTSALESM
jgi:fumarate reductase flavoprotein subunit